jgi:hypothetical protein
MLKWLRHLFGYKVLTYANYVQLDHMWWQSVDDMYDGRLILSSAHIDMIKEFDEAIRWLGTLK